MLQQWFERLAHINVSPFSGWFKSSVGWQWLRLVSISLMFFAGLCNESGWSRAVPQGRCVCTEKTPNNWPQLVLIGNLPGFQQGLPSLWALALNKLLQTMAAAQAALRQSGFISKRLNIWIFNERSFTHLLCGVFPGPALALAPSPLSCPTFSRSSQGCFQTPHSLAIGQTRLTRVCPTGQSRGQGLALWN